MKAIIYLSFGPPVLFSIKKHIFTIQISLKNLYNRFLHQISLLLLTTAVNGRFFNDFIIFSDLILPFLAEHLVYMKFKQLWKLNHCLTYNSRMPKIVDHHRSRLSSFLHLTNKIPVICFHSLKAYAHRNYEFFIFQSFQRFFI